MPARVSDMARANAEQRLASVEVRKALCWRLFVKARMDSPSD